MERAIDPADPFAGRFVLLRLAGEGGMGRVYEALDARGRRLALKVVTNADPLLEARFAAEAEILETLAHPAIVAHVEHGITVGGRPFLAMEWLDGEDLGTRLARGPLAVREAVALGQRVASALAAAHAHGIVHRDLKPSNLYLADGRADRVKVLDFGVARWSGANVQVTQAGVLIGTPGFMAPEQAQASRAIDGRADLFALGSVLYACVSGQPAFGGSDFVDVLARVVLVDPPPVSALVAGVPPRLDALIRRLLAKDPGARPQSAEVLADELEAIADAIDRDTAPGLPVTRRGIIDAPAAPRTPLPPMQRAPVPRPRRRLLYMMAPVMITALALGIWQVAPRAPDVATPDAAVAAGPPLDPNPNPTPDPNPNPNPNPDPIPNPIPNPSPDPNPNPTRTPKPKPRPRPPVNAIDADDLTGSYAGSARISLTMTEPQQTTLSTTGTLAIELREERAGELRVAMISDGVRCVVYALRTGARAKINPEQTCVHGAIRSRISGALAFARVGDRVRLAFDARVHARGTDRGRPLALDATYRFTALRR